MSSAYLMNLYLIQLPYVLTNNISLYIKYEVQQDILIIPTICHKQRDLWTSCDLKTVIF